MAVDPAAAMTSTTASQYVYPADTPYFSVPFDIQNSDPTAQAPATSYLPPPQIPVVPQTFARTYPVYSVTQYQQAQQLFQWDAQIITPQVLESIKAALASTEVEHKAEAKKKAIPHKAAGQTGRLADWPENDFCLFCGDLRNEVNDDVLTKAFMRFPSFNMARVVRDKRTGKTKGYGFVIFANPSDLAAALKEMNGKYVGNRPIKLRKSRWKDRTDFEALEKLKNHTLKKPKVPKRSILHR